jgi:uncharacterized membrane protein
MEPADEVPDRASTWSAAVSGLLCVAGAAVAAYLTYAHYTTAKVLACSDKGLVNCAKVTTSSYSRILSVPVSDAGLFYFVAMAALCSPRAWRSTNRLLRGLRLAAAASGVALIVWLVYVELFRLNAICLYCTAVHAITVLLFITIAIGTASTARIPEDDTFTDDLSLRSTEHLHRTEPVREQ